MAQGTFFLQMWLEFTPISSLAFVRVSSLSNKQEGLQPVVSNVVIEKIIVKAVR